MTTTKDFGCKKIIDVKTIMPSSDINLIEFVLFEDFKRAVTKKDYVLKHGDTYYLFAGNILYQWTNKDEKDEVSNY